MSQASCFRWHKEFNGGRGSCEVADNTIQCLFLTLAIGIYMLKSLGSVTKLFSSNFQVKFGRILD
jgi:hypothetical protein